ncbi:MAG: hypothetical protein M3Q10_08990 [Chloroflexota bacterium]|nr:hypothetical protein [Chloroflexota bacterium]
MTDSVPAGIDPALVEKVRRRDEEAEARLLAIRANAEEAARAAELAERRRLLAANDRRQARARLLRGQGIEPRNYLDQIDYEDR